MHLLDLNLDVLDAILDPLSTPPLSALSMTCRQAREIAIPFLLRTVVLQKSQDQISQFCDFVLADTRRAPMIRSITLVRDAYVTYNIVRIDEITECKFGTRLAEVIVQAANISSLRIDYLDQLIGKEPAIGTALAHLTRLTRVLFDDVGARVYPLLQLMPMVRDAELANVSYLDVFRIIHPFRLSLSCLCLSGTWESPAPFPVVSTVSPKMHTLIISGNIKRGRVTMCSRSTVVRSNVILAFPNLQRLALLGGSWLEIHPGGTCWPALDFVSGASVPLCNLALTCPVRRLSIFSTRRDSGHALAEVLNRAQPVVLSCFLDDEPIILAGFRIFKDTILTRLRALEIRLDTMDMESDPIGAMADFTSSVSHLQIEFLCIDFQIPLSEDTYTESFWTACFHDDVLVPVSKALRNLEFVAWRMVTRTKPESWTYWTVTRQPDSELPNLVEQEPGVGVRKYDEWMNVGPRSSDADSNIHDARPPPMRPELASLIKTPM